MRRASAGQRQKVNTSDAKVSTPDVDYPRVSQRDNTVTAPTRPSSRISKGAPFMPPLESLEPGTKQECTTIKKGRCSGSSVRSVHVKRESSWPPSILTSLLGGSLRESRVAL
ncbi:hypothetical protein PSTT_16671 [Puccinia striiformis]|uniref:Uncharacterized protein n=1 Tax=Puccinia striiformis TaxID=27350 RepID=A0A2S4UBX8_9BASI|nr:hypothetical protein PSTT_16671 [Puccinia striiformis]